MLNANVNSEGADKRIEQDFVGKIHSVNNLLCLKWKWSFSDMFFMCFLIKHIK